MLSRSSFRRPRIAAAAVTVGAALALSLTAIPAQAADGAKPAGTANLAKEQQAVGARIDARLKSLADLQTKVAGYKDLSADHRSTLTTLLASDVSGLTTLKGKVAAETTVEAVRADAKSMIDDYRVYLLVEPKVRLVRVLDAEADATARLVKVHDALADKLAKNAKADTQANKDLLADMSAQIKAADAAADGKIAAVLAIQPGPDDKGIEASLKTVRDAAHDGRTDIGKAVADAKKVRDALK